jgi:hypothetical protein
MSYAVYMDSDPFCLRWAETLEEIPAVLSSLMRSVADRAQFARRQIAAHGPGVEFIYKDAFKNENAGWRVETYENWVASTKRRYLDRPVVEISGDRYDEALNELPPWGWTESGFFACELEALSIRRQYIRINGRCFEGFADCADRSTWLEERHRRTPELFPVAFRFDLDEWRRCAQ